MAVRAAMGAGRLRLVRQLLVESLVLSIVSGLFGFLLAIWGLDALIGLSPANLPGIRNTHIDASVLGFTIILSIATGLLFGVAPALTAWNSDFNNAFKHSTRGAAGAPGSRLRTALVAGEIAVSLLLLTSAGLMLRSFIRLQSVNPGFRAENVLTASMALREARYPEAANMIAFDRALLEKLRLLPGVESAATNTALPFSGQGWGNGVSIEGHPARRGEGPVVQVQCISPRYFVSLGIRLLRGRDFDQRDDEKGAPVAIVAESMAKKFWPGEDPIGKRLELDGPMRTIVGITGDVKKTGLDANEQPQLYIPYAQLAPAMLKFLGRGIFVAIRTSLDPTSVIASLRGGAFTGSRDGAPESDTNEAHDLSISGAASLPNLADWHLFGAGAASGLHRNLRRNVLHRHAAIPRDRPSNGARRGAGRYYAVGARERAEYGLIRDRRGTCPVFGHRKIPPHYAVWGQRARPCHFHRGAPDPHGCCSACELLAGAASDAG